MHRKDFKAESQFQQHLSSKAHKKKAQEVNKKTKKASNARKVGTNGVENTVKSPIINSGSDNESEVSVIEGNNHLKNTNNTGDGNDISDSDEDDDEILRRLTQNIGRLEFQSSESDDDEDPASDIEQKDGSRKVLDIFPGSNDRIPNPVETIQG